MAEEEKVGMHLKKTWQELKTAFPKSLPHYKKTEMEELKSFVKLNLLPGEYSFDVRIPYELTEEEKLLTPEEQRMMRFLKSLRIDLVVETEKEIWLIEVSQKLNLSYVGKLPAYKILYETYMVPYKPLKMGVISFQDVRMVRYALDKMGIFTWIVPR